METLRDALDYSIFLAQADRSHIALFGESLGGYLALSLAMHDKRIKR